MKQILISIKPEWVAAILNGEKTVEIRKTAPKEWVDFLEGRTKEKPEPMTVFIYCTKPNAKEVLSLFVKRARELFGRAVEFIDRERVDNPGMRWSICNGKVVAKFTLSNVESLEELFGQEGWYGGYYPYLGTVSLDKNALCHAACLSEDEVNDYVDYLSKKKIYGYAWHISDLRIFNPKELSEFWAKRAPQSWCYVEELL